MLFWDACAIIYFVEGVDPWANQVTGLVHTLDREHDGHAVSQLSLLECRVKPLRDQNAAILARYERFFSRSDLVQVPISREIVLEAARIRAARNLKTPDALQAATALSLSPGVTFLTNDDGFARVPGLDIRLLA